MSDSRLRVTRDGTTLTFLPDEVVTIGRHPDSSVVVLHSKVSRHHAEVRLEDEVWTLRDQGSSNGTFVAGELVSEIELTGPLKISVGEVDGPSLTLIPEVVGDAVASAEGATVTVRTPEPTATSSIDADRAAKLGRSTTVTRIGRAPDNDVVLEDDDVSWFHAEIRATSSHIEIVDLNSHNGTFVNGRQIDRSGLADLDLVGIGRSLFRFDGQVLQPLQGEGS